MDKFIKYSLSTGFFMVIGAASDAETALDILKSESVDIALIDIKMPAGDGQYVLDKMAFAPGDKPMFVIKSKITDVFKLGDEIIKKWEARATKKISHKPSIFCEFGNELTPIPQRLIKREPQAFIKDVLHRIGTPSNLGGYGYLQTAFALIADEGRLHSGDLMNRIYPEVAKIHKTTPVQVERGIRYMINRTVTSGRDLIITNYLGIPMPPPGKRLTNGELLSALVYCYSRTGEGE